VSEPQADQLLTPFNHAVGRGERYYQQIAINRVVQAILTGRRRVLVTMATGTGKTAVAFQICWKLWTSRWNRAGEYRRPRILYLADRNILVDRPKDGIFAAFGDARCKIESGEVVKSREMYFGIYQALAEDERRVGLFRSFPADFFDLVIVDECHRGSARDESSWRIILDYFQPAVQLGMTATPLREETRDTYLYFGDPVYQYSLRQGIDDGFLAPYRVHRVVTEWDAAGWRPSKEELDRYGRSIPDDEYHTKDFERIVALRARTETIARHLTQFLMKTDRFAKTIVFCVDQEHASEMRTALSKLNGTLFGDGVCARIKEELLKEFDLHTIVRLPNGVFAPYTSIPHQPALLRPLRPHAGRLVLRASPARGSQELHQDGAAPVRKFAACQTWWKQREENERAWTVPVAELVASNCNLDRKNPRAREDIAHLPPEQIAASILEKEQRIAEIMGRIQKLLSRSAES